MQATELRLASGLLAGRCVDARLFEALASEIGSAEREQRVLAAPFELAGRSLWLKGDHMPGKARLRHSLARLLGRRTPRERELANLEWLRARLFRVPRPLAAGVLRRGLALRYQFLALERLEAHVPLNDALANAVPAQRDAWLAELAREVARLHSLRFVHRDLHLRNVLVSTAPAPESGDPRRLTFLDVARGGHPLPRRGADYDLACAFLEAAGDWTQQEQRDFLARYFDELRRQERPADPARLLAAAGERRRELLARIEREPGRWRRATPPVREWDWRSLSP